MKSPKSEVTLGVGGGNDAEGCVVTDMCHTLLSAVCCFVAEGEKIHEVGKCFAPDLVCIQ